LTALSHRSRLIKLKSLNSITTAKHLCSWAGLTPTNNESAGKKKSVRISRAGCYIKPLLVQCATAVVKSEKHPEIRNRYLNLKKRRGHKRAAIAICRMLLTAIYHILKNGKPYNAELYKKLSCCRLQEKSQ
jgi:transposase